MGKGLGMEDFRLDGDVSRCSSFFRSECRACLARVGSSLHGGLRCLDDSVLEGDIAGAVVASTFVQEPNMVRIMPSKGFLPSAPSFVDH